MSNNHDLDLPPHGRLNGTGKLEPPKAQKAPSIKFEFHGPSWALGVLTAGILTGALSLWWLLLAPVFLFRYSKSRHVPTHAG